MVQGSEKFQGARTPLPPTSHDYGREEKISERERAMGVVTSSEEGDSWGAGSEEGDSWGAGR